MKISDSLIYAKATDTINEISKNPIYGFVGGGSGYAVIEFCKGTLPVVQWIAGTLGAIMGVIAFCGWVKNTARPYLKNFFGDAPL